MQPHHAGHFFGLLINGDERHRARIIELGETGDEGVAELLHHRKEPQAQILRRDLLEQFLQRRFVIGPDRAHEHLPAVLDDQMALPLRRIGPHRAARIAAPCKANRRRADHYPRVDRQDAGFVGEQRIDVEFTQLGQIDHHLRQLDQRQRDIVEPRRRHVAIAAQQL